MLSTEDTLEAMRREMRPLLETAMEGVLSKARRVLEEAEHQRAYGLAAMAEELSKRLADIDAERAKGLAEVDARQTELGREIAAMHKHKEAQEGHIVLNIGGYHYETSMQTLRRVPHTFFDAYFSGRYAQDVCNDGSIFVDRDGEHFGHVLEYMRDGVVAVALPGARPSIPLLRILKREFGFYCIELCAENLAVSLQPESAYVHGGDDEDDGTMSNMERYDALTGRWSAAAAMGTARCYFGACVVEGEIYVTGGIDGNSNVLSSIEKYSPFSDTWSTIAPLPNARAFHGAVAVGSAMYVIGGRCSIGGVTTNTVSALTFNSTHGIWTEIAPLPEARERFAACAIKDDIYVFGGYFCYVSHASVFKYNTTTSIWSTLAPMPERSTYHSAIVLGRTLYLVGAGTACSKLYRFDPASNVWTTLTSPGKTEDAATFVLGGCLYVAGGLSHTKSVERYDAATDTWTQVLDMLEGRESYCAVTLGFTGPVEEEQYLSDAFIDRADSGHPHVPFRDN
jgi:N-acetylneuraminic acid mutarotase